MKKYLVYQPIGGVNNQIQSLVHALVMGDLLDRIVVLPHWKVNSQYEILKPTKEYFVISKIKDQVIDQEEFLKMVRDRNLESSLEIQDVQLTYRPEFSEKKFQEHFWALTNLIRDFSYFKHYNLTFSEKETLKIHSLLEQQDIIDLWGKDESEFLVFSFIFGYLDPSMDPLFLKKYKLVPPLYMSRISKFPKDKYLAIHFRRGDFKVYKDIYYQNRESFNNLFESLSCIWPSMENTVQCVDARLNFEKLQKIYISTMIQETDVDEYKELMYLRDKYDTFKVDHIGSVDGVESVIHDLVFCTLAEAFIGIRGSTFSKTITIWRELFFENKKSTFF
jgi:hypothetical protein